MGTAASHHSLLVSKPAAWGPFLVGSVAAHVGLVLVGILYSWLTAGPAIDLNQKPIKASLVRLGKPRDEKLLPRKEELPAPPQEVKAPDAPAPVPVPEVVKPTPTAPALAPSPPAKAAQKQAGEASGVDRRKKLFGAFDKTSKKTDLDELEGAADGDPNGTSATAEGERYYGMLDAQVRRHFDVSQTIPEQERIRLKAHVALFLSKTGGILKVALARSSGNALFDNAVLAAVKKAAPFSPPPDHLRDALQKTGVTLEFTPL